MATGIFSGGIKGGTAAGTLAECIGMSIAFSLGSRENIVSPPAKAAMKTGLSHGRTFCKAAHGFFVAEA